MAEPTPPSPAPMPADEYAWLVGFDGDWRDSWWSGDFLELVARRLRLGEVRAAVDVGCGVGHWGRTLLPLLHPEATLAGVDREPAFAARAATEAEARGIAGRASYRQGVAEALPLPDESADLVTCQTVLMHVADPRAVIAEMRRVRRTSASVRAFRGWVRAVPVRLCRSLSGSNGTKAYDMRRSQAGEAHAVAGAWSQVVSFLVQ
jgi:SAM-dependent methyltransferase